MAEFFDRIQGAVLADRYLETILADWKGTLLLLIQAPILAGLAVLVWQNVGEATPSLYFVMTLSAIWLGCIDACREIVKERPLFLREKMANLNVASYLYSKVYVLGILNAAQVFMYSFIVWNWIDVRVAIGWLILNLMFSTFCGTCLGLLISSVFKRSDYAVGMVPLVILPQILFSKFAIGEDQFEGVSEILFTLMPSRWGVESLEHFAKSDAEILAAGGYMIPLLIFCAIFLLLAYPILRVQKY